MYYIAHTEVCIRGTYGVPRLYILHTCIHIIHTHICIIHYITHTHTTHTPHTHTRRFVHWAFTRSDETCDMLLRTRAVHGCTQVLNVLLMCC